MLNIGMMVAVEIQSVIKKYSENIEEIHISGYDVKKVITDKYNLFIVRSGAGEIAAAAATQFLITNFGVEYIVNFGVVGGLTEEMATTKTCIVEKVVHYDFDTSTVDNCEVGRYIDYPSVYLPTSTELMEKALAVCPTLKKVICASGDKFIADRAKKEELHKTYNADICEMEAAAIVLTCDRNKVPCLLIKCISDGISGGAEEFLKEVNNSADICLEITDKILNSI